MNNNRKLQRSTTDKIIAGVCGGLGEYFNITPARFRLIFVIVALIYGAGVALYIILWFLIPKGETPPAEEETPADTTEK